MNRLTKIVLKNMHMVPGTFSKIYWYAAHPDKYDKETKLKPLRKILERSKITGNITIDVHGRENIPEEDGFIFYPNHQGIFDGFALIEACPRPFSPVMKIELMKIPAVKQIFQCMDALPMERGNARSSLKVIQEVGRRVREQHENWVIFPEGTRSKNGNKLIDFKDGSFKAAVKAKCPIVPVALIDSFKPFDKNEAGHITVQVHVLKPIPFEVYGAMKTAEIADMVKERIEATIAEYENTGE